jgi:hypothetical protein
MKLHSRQFSTQCLCATFGAALILVSGCKVGPSSKNREAKSGAAKTASTNNDFHLDLNCVIDHIQNPSEPFHYSYKHDNADDNLLQEADLTPDTIDGSSKNKYASRALPSEFSISSSQSLPHVVSHVPTPPFSDSNVSW